MTNFSSVRGAIALATILVTTIGSAAPAQAEPAVVAAPSTVQTVLTNVNSGITTGIITVRDGIANTVGRVGSALGLTSPQPLSALVAANADGDALDEQAQCLATAVYFESRGEPIEGQLAVADVVLNRASSGRFANNWCGVVKQHAQFSFVRGGRFPRILTDSAAWRTAQAVARVASLKLARVLPEGTYWYHASYVAPRWRQQMTMVQRIGAHLFYRA